MRAEAGAERVLIEAEWPRWPGDQLSYPPTLSEYLELPEVWEDGQWHTLEGDGSGRYRLPEPSDPDSHVRVRYALPLRRMAEDRAARGWARLRDDVLQVAPIALLLRPMNRSSDRVRLALVHLPVLVGHVPPHRLQLRRDLRHRAQLRR